MLFIINLVHSKYSLSHKFELITWNLLSFVCYIHMNFLCFVLVFSLPSNLVKSCVRPTTFNVDVSFPYCPS